jgi:hypothetical protein
VPPYPHTPIGAARLAYASCPMDRHYGLNAIA